MHFNCIGGADTFIRFTISKYKELHFSKYIHGEGEYNGKGKRTKEIRINCVCITNPNNCKYINSKQIKQNDKDTNKNEF